MTETVEEYNQRMNRQALERWQETHPMPHISEMIRSKFIGKGDVLKAPLIVTISECEMEKIGRQGEDGDFKYVMYFNEIDKGLTLNTTNINLIAIAYGENSEGWIGKRIKLYWDPGVMFAGKPVGGVRVKTPPGLVFNAAAAYGAGAPPAGARFDPMTGMPLTPAPPPAAASAPQPRFDPMTGMPIQAVAPQPASPLQPGVTHVQRTQAHDIYGMPAPATAAAPDEFGGSVDTATGEYKPAGSEFDDDIPF